MFTQLQALKEETLRAACLVVLMIAVTGVSKLGLRVHWIIVATAVVSCDCDVVRGLGSAAPPVLLSSSQV